MLSRAWANYDAWKTTPPEYRDEDEASRFAETTSTKTVKARKARYMDTIFEIRVGDTILVTSGFRYEVGGRRTHYFRKTYRRLAKGPGWAN